MISMCVFIHKHIYVQRAGYEYEIDWRDMGRVRGAEGRVEMM